MLQSLQKSLIHELIEEGHLIRRILHNIADNVLQHCLGKLHVVLKICKADFRLNHPELSGMARRVGVLCTECRSERIHIAECKGIGLNVQLSGNRQIGGLSEEILGIIDGTVFILRNVVQIQRRDLEHLSCTFCITSRDFRCMYINEISLLEELMNRICGKRADPHHRLKGIGAHTKMRHCTQIFKGMTLLLQRIIRSGFSFYLCTQNLHLKRLLRLRSCNNLTRRNDGSTDIQLRQLGKIFDFRGIHQLQILEAGTIVQCNKSDALGIAVGFDPARNRNFLIIEFLRLCKNISDIYQLIGISHAVLLSDSCI